MDQRVGTCSLCGGDVMGQRGPWMGVNPPPPDTCASCGARRADDVIEMRRPRQMGEALGRLRASTADLLTVATGRRCGCNAASWCVQHRPDIASGWGT